MSNTIRDASLTTARRRQIANYGWRNGVGLYGNPSTVKKEQAYASSKGDGPSSDVRLSVLVGAQVIGQTKDACACSATSVPPTLQGFNKSEGGTCSPANNGGGSST
jgi:hypothetical protein